MEEMVTIPLSEYQILKSGVAFINCLKMVGVEDWSEYHNAMVLFGGLLEDELDVDFDAEELDESDACCSEHDCTYEDLTELYSLDKINDIQEKISRHSDLNVLLAVFERFNVKFDVLEKEYGNLLVSFKHYVSDFEFEGNAFKTVNE